ncbi:YihY/virulence factor BrkB family protein [Comamonas odontotermitis]|uniref:YihY/virulence factor BrkB family protein n=1 Tax=Comamonas odontotermitis TaxID=379895 RepID=UPI003752531E
MHDSPPTAWQQFSRRFHPLQPFYNAVQLWLGADGLRMSAAMSFYGMLSLAPLLLLIVGLLGWWLDRAYIESTLIHQVESVMGTQVAGVVRGALQSAQTKSQGLIASAVGFVMLLSGATGVFVELQTSLERLWNHGQDVDKSGTPWWYSLMQRLRGLGYILVLGFLMLISLVITTMLSVTTKWAGTVLHMQAPSLLMGVVNEAVSFVITVTLFVGMMRIGTGDKPRLRYLIAGAGIGALLFTVGKQVLAWYLSTAAVVSAYGAAGSLVVLLMWIYFSSAILLFGASCARALDNADIALHGKAGAVDDTPGVLRPTAGQAATVDFHI